MRIQKPATLHAAAIGGVCAADLISQFELPQYILLYRRKGAGQRRSEGGAGHWRGSGSHDHLAFVISVFNKYNRVADLSMEVK